MSGHSKWSTIKRQKGAADAKRGKLFSKLSKNITVAVRTGGGNTDPAFNAKLRTAIDKAKTAAMPADNIERAIKKGSGEGKEAMESVVYEGYGPAGSAIIIEAVTDNRNRTTQNIRNIFNKQGSRMGEQGSVAWMFEAKGLVLLEKQAGTEDLSLELIDHGAEDIQESEDGLEIYTASNDLDQHKQFLEERGFKLASAEMIMKANQEVDLSEDEQTKLQNLVEALEDDDDVINVHTNARG